MSQTEKDPMEKLTERVTALLIAQTVQVIAVACALILVVVVLTEQRKESCQDIKNGLDSFVVALSEAAGYDPQSKEVQDFKESYADDLAECG